MHASDWAKRIMLPNNNLLLANLRGYLKFAGDHNGTVIDGKAAKPKNATSTKKPKEERKNPGTPDLTSREFFRDIFGGEKPNNKTKT